MKKMKFKITNSKTLNTILLFNFVIFLVFSIFISLNTLFFTNASEKMKNEKVSRDNLFLASVYQNLYSNVTDCYTEFKCEGELDTYFADPESAEAVQIMSVFLRRVKSFNNDQNECYIMSANSDTVISGSGLMTKEAFSYTIKIRNEPAFLNNLYTDGSVRSFQAVRTFNNEMTGMTLFVSSYKNTAMIISYTSQTLNKTLSNSISESGNQATVFWNNEIVCSSLKTSIDQNAVITVEETDMTAYLPIISSAYGTDFHIVYYKYIGGYDQLNRNIAVMSIVFICILILIDLTIYYISRKNFYNPLKNILNKHTGGDNSPGVLNEYAVLDSLVSDLQEKYTRSLNVEEGLKYENAFIRRFTGDTNAQPSEVMAPYEKFMLVKLAIDSGKDNMAHFRKFETALGQKFTYQRITAGDKVSYFILDAGGKGTLDFSVLTESNIFYLAGVSRKSSGSVQSPLEQCEKAFVNAGQDNPVVFYKINLKVDNTIGITQETLNELINRVNKGKLTAVTDLLDSIFELNRHASSGQIKAMCACLADLLHIVSINTNTPIKSFQNFYSIHDMFNYDMLRNMIFDLYTEATQKNIEKSDNRILDIVKCVDEEYHTQISLQSLAERFNLPIEQISKQFKKQTGVNFVNYKQQKRIDKAKAMLLEGKSVNEICQYVGFSSTSIFIRLFEKHVGVTPGKYKQSLAEDTNRT